MAQFHFVEDYERLVASLIASHPIDQAMELAVGGRWHAIGALESNALEYCGLKNGMSLVDFGCGSGRLAHALGKKLQIEYCGIEIVQALLDYAAAKSPQNYKFILNRSLTLPVDSASADMICAFSVFTHLLHAESYLYLSEMRRVLKAGGKAVFTFLEFAEADHWPVFESTVTAQRQNTGPHLNTFIERNAIGVWAQKLGYSVEFLDSKAAPWGGEWLGQTLAILQS